VSTKGNLYADSRIVFPNMSPEGYTLDEPKTVTAKLAESTSSDSLEPLRSKLAESPAGLSVSAKVRWIQENSDFGMSDSTLRRRLKEL